jgi:mutator protein MutT
MIQPLDDAAYRFPISAKGVLCHDGRVLLVGNSRGEWELPGGKLELGETPEACVARELAEELDVWVAVGSLLDAWVYDITNDVHVRVLAYGCSAATMPALLQSPEGQPVALVVPDALDGILLPAGYRRAIAAWFASTTRPA